MFKHIINRNEKASICYTHLIAGGTIIQDGFKSFRNGKETRDESYRFSKHEIFDPLH